MPSFGFRPNLDGYADASLDLLRHVTARSEARLAAADALDRVATAADVRAHQQHVRSAVAAGVGGLVPGAGAGAPPLTRLGTLDAGTHTVERVVYSSLPRVPVTALLYRPRRPAPDGGAPAVLFVCGHADLAKADPEYQAVCALLAGAGFVVLAIDPWGQGERLGYLGADGVPRIPGGTTEHTYAGMQSWWLGESPARYFVHDARRGIDLLAALPEVDPDRIGITGNSGGGMLCTLMAALEPRLAAAAIGTFVTSRGAYLGTGQRQDAEQVIIGGTAAGVDHADLLAAMAPRPVTVLAADYDFFPIEGTLASVDRARRAYALLGAPDAIDLVRSPCTHRYAPELARAAVAFFTRWLRPGGEGPDPGGEPRTFPPRSLRCTTTGQVALDEPTSLFLHDLVRAAHDGAEQPTAGDAVAWLRDRVLADRRPPEDAHARWLPGPTGARHGLWHTEVDLWGAGVLLPVSAEATDGARTVRVLLLPGGTPTLADTHQLLTRRDARDVVLVLDTRGVGTLVPHDKDGLPPEDQASSTYKLLCDLLWLGDSLAAGRIYDVLRAVDVMLGDTRLAAELPGLGPASPVELHAEGIASFPAVAAGLLDHRVARVHVSGDGLDVDRLLRERYYDRGDGAWQWVVPGLARHAPPATLRAALGRRLVLH